MALAFGTAVFQTQAFDVTVVVDHPPYVKLTASDGSEFKLTEGKNILDIKEAQNPVTLSGSEKGRLLEVIYNDNWLLPFAGPHEIYFEAGDELKIYAGEDKGTVTIAMACDEKAIDLKIDKESVKPGLLEVRRNAEVEISARDGYLIDEVDVQPEVDVNLEDGIWSLTASRNLNITVRSHADIAENVKINVDNRTNMTLSDALGNVIPLNDGDNYLSIDPVTQNPLSVKANPGAHMEMVVLNGSMLFPDNYGVYTLTLSEDKFNEIYLISKRDQTNTLTINVDDASHVTITDTNGPLEIADGSNYIVFDFDNGNPVTVEANEGYILRGVSVDGDVLTITDNKVSFFVTRGAVVDIVTGSDEPVDTGWIILTDEDFSGMAAGTEDQPDMDTQLFDDYGYATPEAGLKPSHGSCTSTWGGDKLYPAGGTIAVMGGFLNTPIGDYSGDLKMTFRVRLVPGQTVTRHGLDVMLIRHSRLDEFKRTTYTVTPEWQEYTFTANNGWFYDTKIQFFSLDNDFYYQIDDVRIEHRITGIEPPIAQLPDDVTDNSFLAVWGSTETADEYLLSVYEHGPSSEEVEFNENFESIVTEGEHVTQLPDGWEFNLATEGNRKEFTTDPDYVNSGSKAICFDANGDYLVTPIADAGIKSLSFYIAADTSDPKYDPELGQVIAIGALTDGGWREWINVSVPALLKHHGGATVVEYTDELDRYDNIYAFRFESVMHDRDRILVYLDDIKYTVAGAPQPIYLLEDQLIEGQDNTSFLVVGEDFDTEADYFYTVKARNSHYTSVPSNEIEVFHIHTPEALEPSDITADGFTAHWNCGGKADAFMLNLYQTLEVKATNDSQIVLHEDFSKAKGAGTPFAPESKNPSYAYLNIDDYTYMPGWKASSFSVINGMLGGMAENPSASPEPLAGAISTPAIDLSNNDGICHVKVRGWFRGGDGLIIQGLNAATFAAVPTNVEAEYEIEVDLPLCSASEVLTFYSAGYKDFMIDEITITQNLKKGDKVKIRTHEIPVKDKTARAAEVSGLGYYPGHSLSYDLYAERYYHHNKDRAYTSVNSNEVGVQLDLSGVEKVISDSNLFISGGEGCIILATGQPAHVMIYTIDGLMILGTDSQVGVNRYDVSPGLYIVKANDSSAKVQVR